MMLALAAALWSFAPAPAADADLAAGFADPPPSARPRVFWWWLESNVSEAGITRDLEEMKRAGIGGALIFDAASGVEGTPSGPAFMGPEWRKVFRHAVREADRLGIELSVNLCSGWDSGGPWVTPEHSCQKVVWSEVRARGPRTFDGALPLPSGVPMGPGGRPVFYRDIATVAFPTPAAGANAMAAAAPPGCTRDERVPRVTASSSQPPYPPDRTADGDPETFWVSSGYRPGDGPTEAKPDWLEFAFAEPFAAASIHIVPRPQWGPTACELQASDDGKTFRRICRFDVGHGAPKLVAFDEVRARVFRLLLTGAYDGGINVQVSEVELLARGERPRAAAPIRNWPLKSGNAVLHDPSRPPGATLAEDDPDIPGEAIERRSIIDLSDRLDAEGRLAWDVPEGDWTILRFGHTTTGMQVIFASPGGHGYMLDFLSARAADLQFESVAEPLLADAGDLAGKSLAYFHDDSWEVGAPNWTGAFRDEFRARRGYDIVPYIPVLARRVVDGREISNRFLRDYRRTIADCIAENHYLRTRERCRARGVGFHAEAGGPFFPAFDALQTLGQVDIPMGEFWPGGMYVIKEIASAAHIYGKPWVNAEAFTSIGPHWQEDPFHLKPWGDRAFCEGLTRCVLHTFSHSPPEAGRPGLEYFAGTHFNPNITWWHEARLWTDYLARCQYLLSRGSFVADVCFYYGDDVPNFVPPKRVDPSLGPGYDYDVTNAEALLERFTVRDGRIVLPDGMGYRLLALPEDDRMSIDVLRKIAALVDAGATVVGPKPLRTPGLREYPACDQELRALADRLWAAGERRIIQGRSLREILLDMGVPPDVEFAGAAADARLDFIHRSAPGAEIYFIANPQDRWIEADGIFRVTGRAPEEWSPETGSIRAQPVYDEAGARTRVPLRLAPHGSVFIVFRAPSDDRRITSVARDGKPIFPRPAEGAAPAGDLPAIEIVRREDAGIAIRAWEPGTYTSRSADGRSSRAEVRTPAETIDIEGPWEIRFPPGWGAPASKTYPRLASWTEDADPGVRHFSGTASYRKEFGSAPDLIERAPYLVLDLGEVRNLARVRLNGADLGVAWMRPARIDVSRAVRPGRNVLEIDVTNLWPNRLIGDAALPEAERLTRTNIRSFAKDAALLPSGLLGPARIRTPRVMDLDFSAE